MDPDTEALIDQLMDALHEITVAIDAASKRLMLSLDEIDTTLWVISKSLEPVSGN